MARAKKTREVASRVKGGAGLEEARSLVSGGKPTSAQSFQRLERWFIAARKKKSADHASWCQVAVGALAVEPPGERVANGAATMMIHAASHYLREHGSSDHIDGILAAGALPHSDAHYIASLLGLLGKASQLPAVLAWFDALPGKRISYGSASAPYAVMVDTIVRLKTGNLALLKKQLALADAGKLVLTQHHRFTYEKALERIRSKEPSSYGTSFLSSKPPV